jgi:hypothetical protein
MAAVSLAWVVVAGATALKPYVPHSPGAGVKSLAAPTVVRGVTPLYHWIWTPTPPDQKVGSMSRPVIV